MAVIVDREDPPCEPRGWRPWEDPANAGLLGNTWWVVARRGHDVVGTWLVPVDDAGGATLARREVRALPYAAPRLIDGDRARRRNVWLALLRWLQAATAGIELPLAPDFVDLGAVAEVGGFLEARQTHLVENVRAYVAAHSSRHRNHLGAARRDVVVRWHSEVEGFRFDAAVVGVREDHVSVRRRLAAVLARRGECRILDAERDGQLVGQALVIGSAGYTIVMHSWFDRDCGARGITSLLIDEIVRAELGAGRACTVDLEGSVLAAVDTFMDGTGARPAPYAIVYWYPDRGEILRALAGSLEIPGRSAP